MTGEQLQEVRQKIENARKRIEEIQNLRTQYQQQLRQMDLQEAALSGAIDALTPYVGEEEETTDSVAGAVVQ